MDCNSNHDLFLRANGSLSCWCDYGSLKTLQEFSRDLNYSKDVYFGKVFNDIRSQLKAEIMPFPDYCSKCLVLDYNAKCGTHYSDNRIVNVFQVEPSILCTLECPGCLTKSERLSRIHPPYILSPEIFYKILTDLKNDGVAVEIFDFSGHGEPLLNNKVWEMIRYAKNLYPYSKTSLGTNANFEYTREVIDSGIDEIIFAIDGVDQNSYVPYRVNGEFGKAYGFMRNVCAETVKFNKKINLIWKYVLFEHNDSNEMLLKAQKLAIDAGVSELRFIITQLGDKSTSIYDEDQILRYSNKLNMTVDNYKVNYDQLVTALNQAAKDLRTNPESSINALSYVCQMFARLFRHKEEINGKYTDLLKEIQCISNKLSEDGRRKVVATISHLCE